MLTGKQFRITKPTVGMQLVDDTAKIVTVPTDGIIKILSGPCANGKPHETGLIYALWEGQTISLFAVDVEARGLEIPQTGNGYKPSKRATA